MVVEVLATAEEGEGDNKVVTRNLLFGMPLA